jgi:heme/copper-type cytochrome/quinol oxidase subunit 4
MIPVEPNIPLTKTASHVFSVPLVFRNYEIGFGLMINLTIAPGGWDIYVYLTKTASVLSFIILQTLATVDWTYLPYFDSATSKRRLRRTPFRLLSVIKVILLAQGIKGIIF